MTSAHLVEEVSTPPPPRPPPPPLPLPPLPEGMSLFSETDPPETAQPDSAPPDIVQPAPDTVQPAPDEVHEMPPRPSLPRQGCPTASAPNMLAGGGHNLLAMASDGMTPVQAVAVEAALAHSSTRRKPRRSWLASTFLLVVLAMIAGALGGAARYGWDRQQNAVPTLPPLGEGLPTQVFDQPEGRYLDTTVVLWDGDKVAARIRQSLKTDQMDLGLEFASEDFSDAAIKIRDERFTLSLKGGEPQPAADLDESISNFSRLAEVGSRLVLTVDQVAPLEILPFVSALIENETFLPVEAIGTKANGATMVGGPSGDVKVIGDPEKAEEINRILDQSVSTAQPTSPSISNLPVRRYRFEVDEAAFAANEPLAHATWARYFSQSGPIEIWVDDNGLVRQINTVADGEAVTVRINALGDTMHGLSAGFEGGTTLYPAGDL